MSNDIFIQDELNHLFDHKTLSKAEARTILLKIASGDCSNSQIASFLTVFRMRSVTVEEVEGFREALIELCLGIDLSEFNTIDLCGTGGDGKNTFNISTLAAFVVAGTGQKVAKHGNYGVSSGCGSSNVLEQLGIKFTNDQDLLRRCVDKSGACFMHAPLFHPAMRHVGPVRRELKIKTIFNFLGPLVNPANPNSQFTGVYSPELMRLYSYVLKNLKRNHVIVHSLDGYDEISLTGPFKLLSDREERVYNPEDLGFSPIQPEDISGGDGIKDSAKIFLEVLRNESTEAQANVVIANAGMAIKCVTPEKSIEDAVLEARESLRSGRALKVLQEQLELFENA